MKSRVHVVFMANDNLQCFDFDFKEPYILES